MVREIVWDVHITWLVVASTTIPSSYSPEELVKLKDPNETTDEQQGATEGNNNLVDRKIEHKQKQEESSAGNTCKKVKWAQSLWMLHSFKLTYFEYTTSVYIKFSQAGATQLSMKISLKMERKKIN